MNIKRIVMASGLSVMLAATGCSSQAALRDYETRNLSNSVNRAYDRTYDNTYGYGYNADRSYYGTRNNAVTPNTGAYRGGTARNVYPYTAADRATGAPGAIGFSYDNSWASNQNSLTALQ